MGVTVSGVDELGRALDQAEEDLRKLDIADQVADEAATTMRRFIPVRTGRARRTIAAGRTTDGAAVTVGGPTAPYVPLLRAKHPSRFVERTDQVMETRAAALYEAGWDSIAQKNGLT